MIENIDELTSEAARSSAWQSLWTFPSMILAALVIAWGAESAQFLVSQAFALTILALIQTLPEFAVEGFIAWNAGQYPTVTNIGLMTANFTGALRLLVGLGWPLIFITTVIFNLKKSHKISIARIRLDHEHAVEITGLLAGSIYAIVIVVKGTLTLIDTLVLFLLYGIYIVFLLKLPARGEESIAELEVVPRFILTRRRWQRNILILACFLFGGTGIMLVADPFLESALGLSVVLGVPAFMLIQWLAPFLSEFPEKISALYWAKSVVKAPMALMNMVSSGIAECTLLIGVIPIVFCISLGRIDTINFDWPHRAEILLTATQGILGVIILSKMNFRWFEALGLFVLWASQIYFQYDVSQIAFPQVPDISMHAAIWNLLHVKILASYTYLYWIWIAAEFFMILLFRKSLPALGALKTTWNSRTK